MDIPAPQPFGTAATVAISAPFGRLFREDLDAAQAQQRHPVVLLEPASAAERQNLGPAELRDAAMASLTALGWVAPWGLGGFCIEPSDAEQFATAGCTWFTLDVRSRLDPRASAMSPDELDAAIVALEDAGILPLEWHANYLNRDFPVSPTATLRFTDLELARAGVMLGPALAHAAQLEQTIRACSASGSPAADIEFRMVHPSRRFTALETLFLACELHVRGLGVTAFTCEPVHDPAFDFSESDPDLSSPSAADILLAIGPVKYTGSGHLDSTIPGRIAALRVVAEREPALFREWLESARLAFPVARPGSHVSTTEEEVSSLPETADSELAATFLESRQGRDLLLCTWDIVRAALGPRIAPLVAIPSAPPK